MVNSREFGLISETFKIRSGIDYLLAKDDSFLTGIANETQQKREFHRNNGLAPRGTVSSGNQGTALIFWASGRTVYQTASEEEIKFTEYNGFSDVYLTRTPITRPWNWTSFSSLDTTYFIQGSVTGAIAASTSPTNQTKTSLDLISLAASNVALANANYKNGADELKSNVTIFDETGLPVFDSKKCAYIVQHGKMVDFS